MNLREEVREMLRIRQEALTTKCCPPAPYGCGMPIAPDEFRDELSRRENRISGLCQKCQDNFFGKDDDDEE